MAVSTRYTTRVAKDVTMAVNKRSTSTTMKVGDIKITTNSRTGKVTTSANLGNGIKLKNGKITITL